MPEVLNVSAVLAQLTPELTKKRRIGWGLIILVVLLTAFAMTATIHLEQKAIKRTLQVAMLGALLVAAIFEWVRRSCATVTMPALVSAARLTLSQDGKAFIKTLPPRLLPDASIKIAKDVISGEVEGRQFQFSELDFRKRGKQGRTLFKGFVVCYLNAKPLPAFFLVDQDETQDGTFSKAKIQTTDLAQLGEVVGPSGVVYGLWGNPQGVHNMPLLDTVIKRLLPLEAIAGPGASLYSITSNGEALHVAMRVDRKLFCIGGIFASKDDLVKDTQKAYAELQIPHNIAATLFAVEALV